MPNHVMASWYGNASLIIDRVLCDSTDHRWIHPHGANNLGLWCFYVFSLNKLLNTLTGSWWFATLWPSCFNSSTPSAAYMCRWTESALVQVMACRLFGAKPLPEPMFTFCQLDHQEHTSVKFESKYKTFNSRKCIWKCRLRNCGHLVSASVC